MSWLLLIFMIIVYTLQSFLIRLYSDHYPGDEDMASPVFTIVSGLSVVIVSFAVSGFHFQADWKTLLFGAIGGIALVLYNEAIVKSVQRGPYSVMMVFQISGAIIIPIFSMSMIFGDTVSPVQIICIAVVLVSGYLLSKKEDEGEFKKGFWLASFVLAVANGVYGSFLNLQQRVTGAEEKEEMLATIFGVAVIVASVRLAMRQKKNFFRVMKQTGTSAVYLALCSATVVGGLFLLTALIGMMDLAVLYTFDVSGMLVLSVICSCIFLKEKISPMNVVGLICMSLALVCMSGWDWIAKLLFA
jgi:drug/metabolite transporter (DMT)-like permease